MDIIVRQLWVVKSFQHLDFIFVRLLLWRLPKELLSRRRRSLLYRIIIRHLFSGSTFGPVLRLLCVRGWWWRSFIVIILLRIAGGGPPGDD